jgi:hypothetical protein
MPAHDAAERKRIASIAGLTGWANTVDRSARGRHGQAGLMAKFEQQVRDTNPNLSRPEIRRRADTLYRLHMQRITQASVRSRKARRKEREKQAQAMRSAREAEALQGSRGGAA